MQSTADDDDRPANLLERVPNTVEDDRAEVDSIKAMWLDSHRVGATLLQFYPDAEMVHRQLKSNLAFQQTAVIFQATDTLELPKQIPSRLSTPLSVLCAVYRSGGVLGVYRSGDEIRVSSRGLLRGSRFLVPKAVLVVCSIESPTYIKRLVDYRITTDKRNRGEDTLVHALITSPDPTVMEDVILGREYENNIDLVIRTDTDTLVTMVRRIAVEQYLFRVIELGPDADVTDAASLFDDEKWSINDYGLFEYHNE